MERKVDDPDSDLMDIVLVAGLWLDGSAWDFVVPELTSLGPRPHPGHLAWTGGRCR